MYLAVFLEEKKSRDLHIACNCYLYFQGSAISAREVG